VYAAVKLVGLVKAGDTSWRSVFSCEIWRSHSDVTEESLYIGR
jgi:hypothetical protein